MCKCGQPNKIFTYCREHFLDAWWKGEAVKDNKPLVGMPDVDLRNVAGEWNFSVCVILSDPDYLVKSRKFGLNKLTKGKIYANAQQPGGGMGHAYIRFKSPRLSGATRDYLTFGMMSNGVTSPDGEAGKNTLNSELAIDYVIDDRQKDAVCTVIGDWLAGHITGEQSYNIMTSNCTLFAAECCDAAGVYFPGSRIATHSNSAGGWNKTYTPVKLYSALQKSNYAYDPVRDRSPGDCPTGYMGFQTSKKRPGAPAPGMFGFRKELERFKSETGIKQEDVAVRLLACTRTGDITVPELKVALANATPKEVLDGLTNAV